ncbi:MAG: flagellar biosynthetic protein FliO [Pseudomonadota bacterium]
MTGNWASLLPALGLLALLGLLAWGVQWLRRRTQASGGDAAALRVVAQLMVGPQQRVVVVELDGPGGAVHLTLGVTPQHVRTLHVRPITAAPTTAAQSTEPPPGARPGPAGAPAATPRYADVARAVAAAQRQEPTP